MYWQRFRVRARRTRATWGGTRDERGGDPRVSAPIRRDETRRRPAPSSSPRQASRALRRSGVMRVSLSSSTLTCLARSARQKVNVFESLRGHLPRPSESAEAAQRRAPVVAQERSPRWDTARTRGGSRVSSPGGEAGRHLGARRGFQGSSRRRIHRRLGRGANRLLLTF